MSVGNRMNPLTRISAALRDRLSRRRNSPPEVRLRVSNLTRQTLLATSMEVADSSEKRNKGLLGRKHLGHGEGLWIIPCQSVHTFFMQFPIDLVYLDRKKQIRKLRSAVSPWRISVCLSAHSILELPSGTIWNTRTERGDTLEFSQAYSQSDPSSSLG
jgi:uncharacterized membrane protein (UPF0127 family)